MLVSYSPLDPDLPPLSKCRLSMLQVWRFTLNLLLQLSACQSAHAGQCAENPDQRHCPTNERHGDLGTICPTSGAKNWCDAMERGPDADGRLQGTLVRGVQSLGDHTELSASRNVSGSLHLIGIDNLYAVAAKINVLIEISPSDF